MTPNPLRHISQGYFFISLSCNHLTIKGLDIYTKYYCAPFVKFLLSSEFDFYFTYQFVWSRVDLRRVSLDLEGTGDLGPGIFP